MFDETIADCRPLTDLHGFAHDGQPDLALALEYNIVFSVAECKAWIISCLVRSCLQRVIAVEADELKLHW